MKTILLCCFILAFTSLKAQDVVTLRNGEIINAKVAEVGTTEIKYYKTANPQGPLYVVDKSNVSQIAYANGTSESFPIINTQSPAAITVTTGAPAPTQKVISRKRAARRIRPFFAPLFMPHLDLGHPIDLGHHENFGYYGGGHGGGHYSGGHH